MPGTIAGGKLAAKKNYENHGADFYKQIGSRGGRAKTVKGFALTAKKLCEKTDCDYYKPNHTIAQCSGWRGGSNSRRTAEVELNDREFEIYLEKDYSSLPPLFIKKVNVYGAYKEAGSEAYRYKADINRLHVGKSVYIEDVKSDYNTTIIKRVK